MLSINSLVRNPQLKAGFRFLRKEAQTKSHQLEHSQTIFQTQNCSFSEKTKILFPKESWQYTQTKSKVQRYGHSNVDLNNKTRFFSSKRSNGNEGPTKNTGITPDPKATITVHGNKEKKHSAKAIKRSNSPRISILFTNEDAEYDSKPLFKPKNPYKPTLKPEKRVDASKSFLS